MSGKKIKVIFISSKNSLELIISPMVYKRTSTAVNVFSPPKEIIVFFLGHYFSSMNNLNIRTISATVISLRSLGSSKLNSLW